MKRDTLLVQLEANYWDRITECRTIDGHIPLEADMRRGALITPDGEDSQISAIIAGRFRELFLNWVSHVPGGRVLDVCCGPGWLSLELGRRGQTVDAFDLSPKAIELAERMLRENPYRQGFGQVNYHVQDVTTYDLGCERYDAIAGWSAFHHLQDLPEFIDRVRYALKPGGIAATMDDLPQGRLERGIQLFLLGLLPIYNLTYRQKVVRALKRLNKMGNAHCSQATSRQTSSPLEAICTQEIAPLLYQKFEVIEDFRFNAFAASIESRLGGIARLRYPIARALVLLDRILCRAGLVKGAYKIIIARKQPPD